MKLILVFGVALLVFFVFEFQILVEVLARVLLDKCLYIYIFLIVGEGLGDRI